jgi:acyl-CoA synthetase (AMP-forming)/AMP-acid ligase II
VTLGAAGWFGSASLDTLLGAVSERPFNLAATEAEETAAILFTSGATGPPKGAVYTHGMFAAQVEALREMFPPAENDVDLATFPLFALFDPALGVTAVVPEMNASRPGEADPEKLLRAIGERRATRMFGSPALIERLARFGRAPELRSLRCVLTAGAPVRADVLDRLAPMLDFTARIHTPYGATEALPVSSIDAREILGSTRGETERGGGVCIGRPVAGVRVELIRIADEPIAEWSDDLRVAAGEAGEIAVRGPVVSRKYWSRPEATALAKIAIPGGSEFFHRMGDVGRIDADGRLWFLGRKSHRVETAEGILHSVACEGIFNAHPSVRRTALVGVGKHGARRPAICIELEPSEAKANREEIAYKLKAMAKANPMTRAIRDFLFHPAFPVDVRHNAKIDRPRLAEWAARRVRR